MPELQGKNIVLGLTGGIACYKSAELLRRLQDHGANINVVMTEAATKFITPITMQALSGNPVYIDTWDNRINNNMAHINLTRNADIILIVPCSTNFLAKLANGLADDLLSTLCIAKGQTPLLLAPAMNHEMWMAPATQRNIKLIEADGHILIGPASGDQACGETGSGRMVEPDEILDRVIDFFQPKPLLGKKVLITAGPTSEAIDPIRVITNRSSGRMGYAIAKAASRAGAEVTLVSGPTALACPNNVNRIDVSSAKQMLAAVMQNVEQADIFIAVAAVADWGVANPSKHKLKKHDGKPPQIEFTQNPDILATVAALPNAPWCVGFAAETDNLLEYAQAKRARKGIPVIVANLAQQSMDALDTELLIITSDKQYPLAKQSKEEAAVELIHWIANNQA